MSSPGSGKTTVLAATLDELAGELAIGVVEGDIATDLDAAKLGGRGAQVSLLNTSNGFGGECHLDAPMVNRALQGLDLAPLDLVIIENVGNLVCPAEFDVGEHAKAMVYSVTEGEDKPLKYPVMFRSVDVVLLNKIDLLPISTSTSTPTSRMRHVNPHAILPVSARTGAGMGAWFAWLRRFARRLTQRRTFAATRNTTILVTYPPEESGRLKVMLRYVIDITSDGGVDPNKRRASGPTVDSGGAGASPPRKAAACQRKQQSKQKKR